MRSLASICIVAVVNASNACATVIEYNNNRSVWIAAAGPYTKIGFTGFAENTIITSQYASLGVTFSDGTDRIDLSDHLYPNDDAGLYGAINEIHVAFSQPMHVLAVDHPGSMKFLLYWQGQLSYTSSDFVHGGIGFFAGLISDPPFDAAVILDPTGDVFIDDLYFGPPVPAPSVLSLMAFGALSIRPRRRR